MHGPSCGARCLGEGKSYVSSQGRQPDSQSCRWRKFSRGKGNRTAGKESLTFVKGGAKKAMIQACHFRKGGRRKRREKSPWTTGTLWQALSQKSRQGWRGKTGRRHSTPSDGGQGKRLQRPSDQTPPSRNRGGGGKRQRAKVNARKETSTGGRDVTGADRKEFQQRKNRTGRGQS